MSKRKRSIEGQRGARKEMRAVFDERKRVSTLQAIPIAAPAKRPGRRNWQPRRGASTHRAVGPAADELARAQAREARRRLRDKRGSLIAELANF